MSTFSSVSLHNFKITFAFTNFHTKAGTIQPLSDLTWTIAELDFHIIHHTLMFVLQKGKLQVCKSIVYETINCKEITICQVVVATALF